MSQANVVLAREVFAAISQQNLVRLLELTDPEVEWHSFFALGEEGGVYRGHSGIKRYVSDLHDAWEIVHPEIEDGVGLGSVALLVGRVHYRGRGSGAENQSTAGWVLRFRDEKAVLFRAFRDPEAALTRAGLSD